MARMFLPSADKLHNLFQPSSFYCHTLATCKNTTAPVCKTALLKDYVANSLKAVLFLMDNVWTLVLCISHVNKFIYTIFHFAVGGKL